MRNGNEMKKKIENEIKIGNEIKLDGFEWSRRSI